MGRASAFVRRNADLIEQRKLQILQKGDDADVLRLLPQLNAEIAEEQRTRGHQSEGARAVETMSIAELDAELAALEARGWRRPGHARDLPAEAELADEAEDV